MSIEDEARAARKDAILEAARSVYGRGVMVIAMAAVLGEKWDGWLAGEGDAGYHGLEYAVQMVCWNWFSGGGTAEIAAQRIVAAVAALSARNTRETNG